MTLDCKYFTCPNFSKGLEMCFMADPVIIRLIIDEEKPILPVCKTVLLSMNWKLEYVPQFNAYRRIIV